MVLWTTFIPQHLPPPNPDPKEGPQEVLANLANARDLHILLNNLKPMKEAATRQTVPFMHNNLAVARVAGLDTDTARYIHEQYTVKYAMKGDSTK